MPIQPSQPEIARLRRFYEQTVKRLARRLRDNLNLDALGRARLTILMTQTMDILRELDAFTGRWANRNIVRLYEAALRDSKRRLRKLGFRRTMDSIGRYSVLNRRAIESLLVDPEVGFVSSLQDATDEIRKRLKTIRDQAKLLRSQQRAFDETIVRVGILEGESLNTVRDQLVNDMVKLKKSNEMVFTPKARRLGPQNIVKNVADLPYIKIQTVNGLRMLRVDDYATLLARTKTKQATNLARRHALLQHGQALVQISANRPLQDDACWLYVGKVFALTQEAAREHGVPHVAELPSGGAPFHPNCTHDERAFLMDFRSAEEKELGFQRPPKWALNRPWPEVQKTYKARGGKGSIGRYNKAALEFSRTTGGRERRRRAAGLPPATGLTVEEELALEGL